MAAPTGEQVIAYAETFKGVARGRKRENVNIFTEWYYGTSSVAASFCLIGICYVLNHFGALGLLGGKIAYVPDLRKRAGGKWHTSKASIAMGDPVTFDFNRSGSPEHVGLFIRWVDKAHTEFVSFEFNTTGGGSDDWCGEKTRRWSDVYGYVKPGLAPANPGVYDGRIYRYARGKALMTGAHVRWIQQRLGAHGHRVKVDGEYGRLTAAAVVEFQRDNRLTSDGEVGPKTWKALAHA